MDTAHPHSGWWHSTHPLEQIRAISKWLGGISKVSLSNKRKIQKTFRGGLCFEIKLPYQILLSVTDALLHS